MHDLGMQLYKFIRNWLASRLGEIAADSILRIFAAVFYSCGSVAFTFSVLVHSEGYRLWSIIAIFITSIILWTLTFHFIAKDFGYYIGIINLGKWSVLSKNWVRLIDYIYLFLSLVGVLRIVIGLTEQGQELIYFNASASLALSIAVALRITKTSIEIFEWDKKPGVSFLTASK